MGSDYPVVKIVPLTKTLYVLAAPYPHLPNGRPEAPDEIKPCQNLYQIRNVCPTPLLPPSVMQDRHPANQVNPREDRIKVGIMAVIIDIG